MPKPEKGFAGGRRGRSPNKKSASAQRTRRNSQNKKPIGQKVKDVDKESQITSRVTQKNSPTKEMPSISPPQKPKLEIMSSLSVVQLQQQQSMRKFKIPKRDSSKEAGGAPKSTVLINSAIQRVQEDTDSCSSSKASLPVISKNEKAPGRASPLKARRRLDNQKQTASISEVNIKNETNSICKTTAQPLRKIYQDLPDYEDVISSSSEEQEDSSPRRMEWDNPIPQIMKMVQEDATVPLVKEANNIEVPENETATSMDIDLSQPDTAILTSSPISEQVLVIADTNIWINELRLIEDLINRDFGNQIKPIIIVPWMTLQELDVGSHLKNKIQAKIRRPINYIYSLLSSHHPRIRGQKSFEAAVTKLNSNEMFADDSILNCVIQNQKFNNAVIFVSNDRNLLNKALVHGIIAVDSRNVMKQILEILEGKHNSPNKSLLPPLITGSPSPSFGTTNLGTKRRFDNGRFSEINDYEDVNMEEDAPMCKVQATGQPFTSANDFQRMESALLNAFSHIIQRKMIEDYGEKGWEYALKIKPPWNLFDSVRCMLLHWIANFQFVFTRSGQKHLENLKGLLENRRNSQCDTRDSQEKIVDSGISLLNLIDKSFDGDMPVEECKRVLLFKSFFLLQSLCQNR